MSTATVSIIYNRRNKLNAQNQAAIDLVFYQKEPRIRKYVSTGINIEPTQWSNEKNAIIKHPNAPHLNKILRDKVQELEDYIYTNFNSGRTITANDLNEFLQGNKVNTASFTEFYKQEIDPALRRGTRKEHIYTFNILSEFRKEILFTEIDYTLVTDFDKFMTNVKHLAPNTRHKHHQHIKRFLRLAELKGLFEANKNPYLNFKTKKTKGDRTALTIAELKSIEDLQIPSSYIEIYDVWNMFLFSCYTGLRYSDVETLEKKHIIETQDGKSVKKEMIKVNKNVLLPLELLFDGKPAKILEHYYKNDTTRIFPKFTNQHVNRVLKTIALMAKIDVRLTFHVARHTFGTRLAEITQNPYLIMQLMGHADIDTSMIYIHLSHERINKQLRGLNWEL